MRNINKLCADCPFRQRKTWDQRYLPANYHAIGFTHAFNWCSCAEQRCTKVYAAQCWKKTHKPETKHEQKDVK